MLDERVVHNYFKPVSIYPRDSIQGLTERWFDTKYVKLLKRMKNYRTLRFDLKKAKMIKYPVSHIAELLLRR
jgi:hypothetical protein